MNLAGYDLRNVDLQEAILRGANLQVANLRGAILIRADLRTADLHGVWLDNIESDLRDADLRGATLSEALIDESDVRGARGMILDSTRVRNARFSATARDPWSVLRKSYTGPRLGLNLLLLVAFLTPYVLKAVGWMGVNRVETGANDAVSRIVVKAEEATDQDALYAELLHVIAHELATHAPSTENGWREYPLWQVLMGVDREATYWITAMALIAYNLLRAFLTLMVAPLRDEEERSGHAPAYRPEPLAGATRLERILNGVCDPGAFFARYRNAYAWMLWPHRVVRGLFVFAVAAFVFHLWSWFRTPILLPPT